jgi:hypothetical protein
MLDFLNENLAKVCANMFSDGRVLVTRVSEEGRAGADVCLLQLPFANAAQSRVSGRELFVN